MRGVAGPLGRGIVAYVRLIDLLRRKPLSAKEIEVAAHASPGVARRMSRRLLDAGILRVHEWRDVGHGPLVRVLGVGKPPTAVLQFPPPVKGGQPSRHCGAIERGSRGFQADQFIALWKQLAREPSSVAMLMNATGLHEHTVLTVTRELRRLNLGRIADWRCGQGDRAPLWRLGSKRDAVRPPPLPRIVLQRRYVARRIEKRAHLLRLAANASIFNFAQSCA